MKKTILISILLFLISPCFAGDKIYTDDDLTKHKNKDNYNQSWLKGTRSTREIRPTVSNIEVRITKRDITDDVWFSIKADVTNNGPSGKIFVTLQGIDSQGFELKTILLSGFIEEGQTKTLSHETYVESSKFNEIREWKVKD